MKIVNVHEAKSGFSKLLDRAHRGEEIILAKGGKPWARLMPLESKKRTAGGKPIASGMAALEPLPDAELSMWEGA